MDVVEISNTQYEIYTQQEADNRGIDYIHWHDVTEQGQWALTDDGYVCEVRYIYGPYEGNDRRNIVLSGGRGWDDENYEINYEEFKEVGNFSFSKPHTHGSHEMRRKRSKMAVDFYALQVLDGVSHKNMPWDILGKMYSPDAKKPSWSAQKLFKQTETMVEVSRRIKEILDEQGLSDSDIARSYKDLLEESMDSEDLTNWRLTLDSVAKMRGIDKPQQKQNVLEETVNFSREIGEGLSKEKQKIEARRKRQVDQDDD